MSRKTSVISHLNSLTNVAPKLIRFAGVGTHVGKPALGDGIGLGFAVGDRVRGVVGVLVKKPPVALALGLIDGLKVGIVVGTILAEYW